MKKIILSLLVCVCTYASVQAQIPKMEIPAQRSQKYVENAIKGKWVLDTQKLMSQTLSDYAKEGKTLSYEEKADLKKIVESKTALMEFKEEGILVQKVENNPEEVLGWTYDEKTAKIILTLPNGKKDKISVVKLTKYVFVFGTSDGDVFFRREKE